MSYYNSKKFDKKSYILSAPAFFLILICSLFFLFTLSLSNFHFVDAHFSHLAHINAGGFGISEKYYVNEQTDPEEPIPNQLAQIQFSIQDRNGLDVHNITALVEVYASNGTRLSIFPWTKLDSGDFSVPFIFPKSGMFQVVVSVLNDGASTSQLVNTIPPPRLLLNDDTGCNCERGVFNVAVSNTFGSIFIIMLYIALFGTVSVLGTVLIWMYWSRRRNPLFSDTSKYDSLKYFVLIFALGASVVHLAVYPEHGALRLEYSIFLLSASGIQLAYGIMYILLIFSEDNVIDNRLKKSDKLLVTKQYYKKSVILNLFGLIGSLVLILLYVYAITFPPPLSPNSKPEDVDLSGVIDKALEVIMVIGIVVLMRYERRRYLYTFRTSKLKKF
ncbi:MAG TPA: hypothetical protein VN704_02930 [Verrucomicrobiae bacterium]|nr:hypothetical protein [Verrucomicrobiae bacterium]